MLYSNRGMSLISVLVALGLAGGLMFILTKFVQQSNRQKLANEQHFEADNMRTLAKNIVRTSPRGGLPDTGAGAVIGAAAPQVNFNLGASPGLDTSASVIPVGNLGGQLSAANTQFDSITLQSMELRGIERPTGNLDGRGTLRLNARKRLKTGASEDVTQDIPVQLRFASGAAPSTNIVDCFGDDGDVVGATETYLNSNLDQRIDNRINSNFDEYIDEQIINNPSSLVKIVNNPAVRTVVQEVVCDGIEGAVWDETNKKCTFAGGTTVITNPGTPVVAPPPPQKTCKGNREWYGRGVHGAQRGGYNTSKAACNDKSITQNMSVNECPNGWKFEKSHDCSPGKNPSRQIIQCCKLE